MEGDSRRILVQPKNSNISYDDAGKGWTYRDYGSDGANRRLWSPRGLAGATESKGAVVVHDGAGDTETGSCRLFLQQGKPTHEENAVSAWSIQHFVVMAASKESVEFGTKPWQRRKQDIWRWQQRRGGGQCRLNETRAAPSLGRQDMCATK
jgi:hypothetical protein